MTGIDIRWEVDGTKLKSSELVLGDEPADLKPRIFRIKMVRVYAAGGGTEVWDRLFLVVNRHDTKSVFDKWYDDNADIGWTTNLPAPFASITVEVKTNLNWWGSTSISTNASVTNLAGSGWHPPDPKKTYMHHDARFEMRSHPITGGHGHQACYDAEGVLITNGIAAGSADLWAPYNSWNIPYPNDNHLKHDVKPFIRALQLDGNPVHPTDIYRNLTRPCIHKGKNTDKYVERRPVLPKGGKK